MGLSTDWLQRDSPPRVGRNRHLLRDPFGRVEQGRQWAASMSAGTFESFADAGHLPWLDDPATHAARIAAFLGAEAPAPA